MSKNNLYGNFDIQVFKGKRTESTVPKRAGVYFQWFWNENKAKYELPDNNKYRARRFRKILGKSTPESKFFNTFDAAWNWKNGIEEVSEYSAVEEHKPDFRKIFNKSSEMTMEFLINDWLRKNKPPVLEQTSWDFYQKKTGHLFLLGSLKVEDLCSEDIYNWLDLLKKPDYPRQPTRVSYGRELEILVTVLKWYRNNYNSRYQHPVIKDHFRYSVIKNKPVYEPKELSLEEVENFLSSIKAKSKSVFFYLASFQVLTGCRIGECCGLLWDSIDFKTDSLTIRTRVVWHYNGKDPELLPGTKNKKSRIIKMNPRLKYLLTEWKLQCGHPKIVFHLNGEYLNYCKIQKQYNKALIAIGSKFRSTHILRHSFATIYCLQTGDIRATQAILGHSSIKMTERYAKLSEKLQDNAMDSFTMGQLLPDSPQQKEGKKR